MSEGNPSMVMVVVGIPGAVISKFTCERTQSIGL